MSLDSASSLKQTVFVGGPFSSALRFDASGAIVGFDERLRATFEDVYAWLGARGLGILSSHVAEKFGFDVHEATLVQRDNTWLRVCDTYLAVLPFSHETQQPYRTDGTFVEIGLAIALERPCVLLVENARHPAWSYYVRNLDAEPGVIVADLQGGEAGWNAALEHALTMAAAKARQQTHVDNPEILRSLIQGASLGHTVAVGGVSIVVPAVVVSSRYDAVGAAMVASLAGVAVGRAAVIAADSGELAFAAAVGGAAAVTAVAVSPEAAAAIAANLARVPGTGIQLTREHGTVNGPLDLLVVHVPPLSSERSTFADLASAALDSAQALWSKRAPSACMTVLCGNSAAREFALARLAATMVGCQYETEQMGAGAIVRIRAVE